MAEETTGILQELVKNSAEIVVGAVVDGISYEVPENVSKFISRRYVNSTVTFDYQVSTDGKKRKITFLHAAKAEGFKTGNEVKKEEKRISGDLKAIHPTSHKIDLSRGSGIISVHAPAVWHDIESIPLGSTIECFYGDAGTVNLVTVLSPARPDAKKELAQNLPEKAPMAQNNGSAQKPAEKPEEETGPAKEPETCTSSSHPVFLWTDIATIDLECTVNLDNYENIKVRVSGSNSDRDKLIALLNDTLGQFGKDAITREKIAAYQRRVLG
jgi:hypothetical protein